MSMTGPLQVVPDIDDESNKQSQEDNIAPVKEGQSEFEHKLEKARMDTSELIPKQRKYVLHRRRPGVQPPITRVGHDAGPVSVDPHYQKRNPFLLS